MRATTSIALSSIAAVSLAVELLRSDGWSDVSSVVVFILPPVVFAIVGLRLASRRHEPQERRAVHANWCRILYWLFLPWLAGAAAKWIFIDLHAEALLQLDSPAARTFFFVVFASYVASVPLCGFMFVHAWAKHEPSTPSRALSLPLVSAGMTLVSTAAGGLWMFFIMGAGV